MTRDEILKTPAMQIFSPSYPLGSFRFVRREYLIFSYKTDPDSYRTVLPEPLEAVPGNIAYYDAKDMLVGTLHYDGERVAMGTMRYKTESLEHRLDEVKTGLAKLT
jgi:acetoacetate decarboxylase